MTSEAQIFAKDKLKLNILQDVLSGLVNISFQLDHDPAQNYASQIHADGKRVYVFGKFNVSEDASEGDTITIRPIMIDVPLKISFHAGAAFSGKKASLIRNATKAVEQEFEISSETESIELLPQGKQFYLVKVTNRGGIAAAPTRDTPRKPQEEPTYPGAPGPKWRTKPYPPSPFEEAGSSGQEPSPSPVDERFDVSDFETGFNGKDNRFDFFNGGPASGAGQTIPAPSIEPAGEIPGWSNGTSQASSAQDVSSGAGRQDGRDLQRIEQEISAIERQQGELSRKKQSAIEHLEKIEAEYKKDYAALGRELEDYKSRMEADAAVIEHYKDQDVKPVEIILRQAGLKLEEAEEQILFFIEAKQRKTMEIESEIKSNKKQ